MSCLIFNGKFLPSNTPLVTAQNRGLRYGDGLFETMKFLDGRLCNASFHFERFFQGLKLLSFEWPVFFNAAYLEDQVLAIANKNGHLAGARIRLMAFRRNGGLYDPENHHPEWVIESLPLPENARKLNENGLVTGFFPDGKKICDSFSALKINSFLPYTVAALYAKQQRWNDAIVLNQYDRIADTTIANVWWVEGDRLFTPPLSEGCIAGTMRRFLLETGVKGFTLEEQPVAKERLLSADSVFLTNAIYGVKWVRQIEDVPFPPGIATHIFTGIQATI